MPRQQEFEAKIVRIRAFLQNSGLNAVALSTQALFAWATAGGENYVVLGSDGGVGTFLVTRDQLIVLANNIEIERFKVEEFNGIQTRNIEFWTCPWHGEAGVPAEIRRRMSGERWMCDSGLPGSEQISAQFLELTYTLTENEIARYAKLGKDCSLAMEEAVREVRPGMSEHSVAGLICARMWDHDVRPNLALVAADERALHVRHPIPTTKKVKRHLLSVLCGKRGGLIINITRMRHFARKLPDELRRKHDAVCAVDMAFNLATRPGVPVNKIFAAGVAAYEAQGFGAEWMLHHQGGPTGYQGRSYFGKPSEKRPALLDQAFAWNPSITGTKSEDTIIVRKQGIEFLSAPTQKWPALKIKAGGQTYRRADILVG